MLFTAFYRSLQIKIKYRVYLRITSDLSLDYIAFYNLTETFRLNGEKIAF
jgi:hypothetical protein